jgi:hypothetical protein
MNSRKGRFFIMEKTNVFVMAAAALTFTPVPDGCAGSGGGPNTKPGLLLRTAPSEIQAQDDGREFAVYLAFGLYCGLSLYAENFPARAPARVFPPERKDFPPEGKVFPLEEKDFPPEGKGFLPGENSFSPEGKRPYTLNNGE